MQVRKPMYSNACNYLRIVGLGEPFVYCHCYTSSFNGAGKSRLSFLANATGLVVNMISTPHDLGLGGVSKAQPLPP